MQASQQMNGRSQHEHVPNEIAVALIDESPTNPRKTFTGVEELAADIKARGVLQDVLLRPHPKKAGRYELVFGARRFRATKLAGLKTIPAKVRALTDAEVLEIQIVENSKRADIHPLEEADGYEQLHSKHGFSVEDIAAKVGKSVATVRARLKLSAIAPKVREAVFAEKITLGAALVLARLPTHDVQARALAGSLERWQKGDRPLSESELTWQVRSKFMLRLVDAPFDRTDEALVEGAPACSGCPKRTGNQRELFGDLDGEKDDLCTDAKCFEAKKAAAYAKTVAAAKEKGQTVLPEKRAKALFSYGGQLRHDAGFVDLAAENYDDPKRRKNKVILGKAEVPIVVARDPEGGVHHLVAVDDFRKVAKDAGIKAPSKPADAFSAKAKAERQRAAKAKEKFAATMGELVAKVERRQPNDAFWRALARAFVREASADARSTICHRRGIEVPKSTNGSLSEGPHKALLGVVATMTGSEARGLVVELAGTTYGGLTSQTFKELVATFGKRTVKR